MNGTAIVVIGLIVVVLLVSRPAQAALPAAPGPQVPVVAQPQNEAKDSTYNDVVGAMAVAFAGITSLINAAGTQRN